MVLYYRPFPFGPTKTTVVYSQMPPLKSHWGLWLVLVVVALQQPNAVTQDNEQVADDNKHGALVAVETEDEDEPVPGMYRTA